VAKLLNQKSAIKLLKKHGWTKTVGGKHGVKMVRSGDRPITLPTHRGGDYGLDLTRRILKQAGIDPGEL
jgi:predicted RNA binding protein YcfA (HicA-like mRNA interferase family)